MEMADASFVTEQYRTEDRLDTRRSSSETGEDVLRRHFGQVARARRRVAALRR